LNTLLVSLVKSLLELGDVVVEQFEIVGDLFFAATEGIRTTTCPPVSRAMLFGVLRSKYGSNDDDFDAVALHQPDQFHSVLRARGMPGRGST